MNVYDSQVAAGILEKAGFEVMADNDALTPDPLSKGAGEGPSAKTISGGADIVLMNTCSVREHAEERVWGRLGMLGGEKKMRPELVIGLLGCMVEEHKESLFKRFPYLDLIAGTRHIKELPEMIRQVYASRRQVARIQQDGISIEYSEYTKRDSPYHAWLPIMTGCNKECTFCIVPLTRGGEVSVPAHEVCEEAKRLIAGGVKWITLLGQNVNSYGEAKDQRLKTKDFGLQSSVSGPVAERNIGFPHLLEMLCSIEGLERISFTTSHPSDATEELFQVIARNPKISRRFHLPLQSGSDRILKRMKRYHTYAEYKAKVDRLRELVPEIAVTTDIIAGFSGETEEDYQATQRALEALRFDGAFIYKYSVRPRTPAAKLPDDVPLEVKAARNNELLALQRSVTEDRNRDMIGKIVTAFVEEKREGGSYAARTDHDKRVILASVEDLRGKFVRVRLLDLRHETFRGELIQ